MKRKFRSFMPQPDAPRPSQSRTVSDGPESEFPRDWDPSILDRSDVLAERARAEEAIRLRPRRALTVGEIERLEAAGCRAEDWSRVRVAEDFSPEAVSGSRFEGEVLLGSSAAGGAGSRPGVYDSTVADCAVGDGCRIARCGRVERCVLGPGSVVENVNRVGMSGARSSFGNGIELFREPLFARPLRIVAGLPFEWAAWVTSPEIAREEPTAIAELNGAVAARADRFSSDRAYLGAGSRVRSVAVLEDCWIGEGVEIEASGSIRNSTIWGAPEEPTILRDGATVRNSIIGPGCVMENHCCVENSILFEHVTVGSHAIVRGCAVGPNTRLSGSEANDSLLGPFIMAIHHGLILAAWWPEGKGNLAYGSNVGSNHTGRAPDQEIWPGEGAFFGLGCDIKFPTNFRRAPYTVIATGVNSLPQRVDFPFSLITVPSGDFGQGSPALNEIAPGWGLLNNAYGIERHERNLEARDRARRMRIVTETFRPSIVSLLAQAAARLEIPPAQRRGVYTEREIAGLGKNYLTERLRSDGIEAYRFGIGLAGAKALLKTLATARGDATLADAERERLDWAAGLLREADPDALIDAALGFQRRWVLLLEESKSRDDRRGAAILDDYAARHVSANADPWIVCVREELQGIESRRDELAQLLRSHLSRVRPARAHGHPDDS